MICANAIVIADLPYSTVLNTTTESADPSVPDTECGTGNSLRAVWLTWTAPADGRVTCTLGGADESTVTIFQGSCGALDPLDPAPFGDICVYVGSPNTFETVAGRTYFFLVTAFDPAGEAALPFDLIYGSPDMQLCVVLTCETPPEPPTITDLAVVCDLRQIVITGTNFTDEDAIDLTLDGDPIPFTVVSRDATSVVLQLTDSFVDGTYCATIADSDTFCAALS